MLHHASRLPKFFHVRLHDSVLGWKFAKQGVVYAQGLQKTSRRAGMQMVGIVKKSMPQTDILLVDGQKGQTRLYRMYRPL